MKLGAIVARAVRSGGNAACVTKYAGVNAAAARASLPPVLKNSQVRAVARIVSFSHVVITRVAVGTLSG